MAPKPKSWLVRQKVLGARIHVTEGLLERFVRQKVLGANIDETEGLLERNIARRRKRVCVCMYLCLGVRARMHG